MKTSIKRANNEVDPTSMINQMPPKRRTDDEGSGHFTDEDDEFTIPLDDDLDTLADLDLDDDEF